MDEWMEQIARSNLNPDERLSFFDYGTPLEVLDQSTGRDECIGYDQCLVVVTVCDIKFVPIRYSEREQRTDVPVRSYPRYGTSVRTGRVKTTRDDGVGRVTVEVEFSFPDGTKKALDLMKPRKWRAMAFCS